MKKQNLYLGIGILVLVFLLISYFVPIQIEEGSNFNVITPLLGIIIFYQIPVLGLYILIGLFLVYKGIKGRIKII